MKYLILIYSNPTTREGLGGLPRAQRAEGLAHLCGPPRGPGRVGRADRVGGRWPIPSLAKRVAVRDGRT